jgi:protein tyrosine phosphatase
MLHLLKSNSSKTKSKQISEAVPQWLSNYLRSPEETLQLLEERELARSRYRWASISSYSTSASHDKHDDALRQWYSIREAATERARSLNRYYDILPYDRTRIRLCHDMDQYINASWVQEVYGGSWWIASQAPPPQAIHSFLRMFTTGVSSHTSGQPLLPKLIVQATREFEGRRPVRKADQYIPSEVGQKLRFASENPARGIEVELSHREEDQGSGAIISSLLLRPYDLDEASQASSSTAPPSEVKHILFEAWPDHGVPTEQEPVIQLARLISKLNPESEPASEPLPAVVHCSAGIGRTGTLISASSILRHYGFLSKPSIPTLPIQSPLGPVSNDDEIAKEVDGLREQRPGMVQRDEQITFVYKVLKYALERRAGNE